MRKKKEGKKFIDIYKKVKNIYEKIFINSDNKKLYWFGVSCLPLAYFVTINIFALNIRHKNEIKKLYKYYNQKILYKNFKNTSFKNFLKKIYFIFLNLLFTFKKKIFIVYSSNAFTNMFCEKKNYFKIKIDPLWYFKFNEISEVKLDKIFIKKIDIFLNQVTKIFLLNLTKNKKNKIKKKIKDQFIFYYKIYIVMINNTKKNKNYFFITSYTSVIYVRLFLSALRFNNASNIFTLTHGEVEILNQQPNLNGDPSILGNYLVFKGLKYKEKYKNFFLKINKNYKKPKLLGFRNYDDLKSIKKNYLNYRNNSKKILVVGYPRSYHYNIDFPQISPINYYKVEIKLMEKLKSLGYDVTYKIHPDRIKGNIELFKNFKVIKDPYESVEKEFKYSIFTYHRSTALGNALKNNSSILLLYYRMLDIDNHTYKVLSQRISFIQLSYIKNKILLKISNSGLNKAIKKSNELVNYKSIIKMII